MVSCSFKCSIRLHVMPYLIIRAKFLIANVHKLHYQCPKPEFPFDLTPTTAACNEQQSIYSVLPSSKVTHLFFEHAVLPPRIRLEECVHLLERHISRLRNEVRCPDECRCARAREDYERRPTHAHQHGYKGMPSYARRGEIHENRREQPDEDYARDERPIRG